MLLKYLAGEAWASEAFLAMATDEPAIAKPKGRARRVRRRAS